MLQQARSLYGFAERKRDSILPTFENNRRLVKFSLYIYDNNYSNVEINLINSYFTYQIFLNHEAFYLCLEYILDNFSEIGTKSLHDKCIKRYHEAYADIIKLLY